MKRKLLSVSALFAFMIPTFLTVNASHLSDKLQISSWMNSANQLHSVTSNAVGVASFTLNPGRDSLCVSIAVNGLSGAITGIHVHEGNASANGAVVTDLTPYINGNIIKTVLTGTDLTPAMLSKYLSGEYYLNLHTAANPQGEIRGQLMLETDWSFKARVDTAQHTHVVSNNAYGLSVFNLSKDQSTLNVYVVADSLSGAITASHLHYGMAGTNGGVAVDLSSLVSGNNIIGTIDVSGNPNLKDSLMAGRVYLNMHTAANGAGELRGQLMLDKKIAFDSWLNAAQTNPASGASATGVADITISTTFDTIWYDIQVEGLTGPITAIHLHDGALGVNGGVLLDLSSGINGDRVSGMLFGASVTSNVSKLLKGGVYINLHTTANGGGEIRGQVYRSAREGLVLNLEGSQEIPSITTSGTGFGIVSIDRYKTNAHFMTVASNLSGAVNSAHFHDAIMGVSGGVIYDVSSTLVVNGNDVSSTGFWSTNSTTAFTSAMADKFLTDGVYLNMHTTANPGGELRGQVLRYSACFLATGIEDFNNTSLNTLHYPNPVNNVLNIDIEDNYETVEISITDINGRVVLTEKAFNNQLISLQLNNIETGFYLVHLKTSTSSDVFKIIKQ